MKEEFATIFWNGDEAIIAIRHPQRFNETEIADAIEDIRLALDHLQRRVIKNLNITEGGAR